MSGIIIVEDRRLAVFLRDVQRQCLVPTGACAWAVVPLAEAMPLSQMAACIE